MPRIKVKEVRKSVSPRKTAKAANPAVDPKLQHEAKTVAKVTRHGSKNGNGANLGFEAQLFETANGLRGNVDAAEYKHIVLGLVFLKYISDMFEEHRAKLGATKGADPDDRDEYKAENVFWVPETARWPKIQSAAKTPKIGQMLDEAMIAIERENTDLQGVLPKEYANPKLDPARLGRLIDVISGVGFSKEDVESRDILGRVYEYFLKEFAGQEGKKAGEFYTPRCIVRLLVEMIEPFKGRVFDPACGSGGMFVQSEEFVIAHGGRMGDISIYGQESNHTTWRLAKMNMAIHGIDADIRWNPQGSFFKDALPDLKADFILANPPFNDKTWGGEQLRDDKRWRYGVPPAGNANYAWIQHFVSHLGATGVAAFVMANGSMSSNQSGEGEIRKALIHDNLVDCIVALPGQLFYGTQIPVCVWILARDRQNHKFRDRRKEVLFIDARQLGSMVDRTHRDLTSADIQKIAGTYHNWRSTNASYSDISGFCKSATVDAIKDSEYILTPGRHVGTGEAQDEGEAFDLAIARLVKDLEQQRKETLRLDALIAENLRSLGYAD